MIAQQCGDRDETVDATSFEKFGKTLLTAVNDHLQRSCIEISKGTIVDATIIGAPSSTKNEDGKGPAMVLRHEGAIGVDSKTKLAHTVPACRLAYLSMRIGKCSILKRYRQSGQPKPRRGSTSLESRAADAG